jgi:hypothetical protein
VCHDLQGGGFSPKRLRAMLLGGVDRRRKQGGQDPEDREEEEEEEGDAGDDYAAVPKASVRSDADDEARGERSASVLSLLPPPSSSSPCRQQFESFPLLCSVQFCIARSRPFGLGGRSIDNA